MSISGFKQLQKFKYGFYSSGAPFLIFIVLLVLFNSQLMAQGNLLIYPHRVVFEGQKRVMEMTITNIGVDSAKYTMSFLQYKLTDNGVYQKVTTPEPGQKFADKYIRFMPRTVMLGPKETQVVLLQLTKSEQLEPGEYRSHFYLRALPNQKVLGEENAKKDSTISIKITPVFGMTIPVIIRVGEYTTTVNLADLKLEAATDSTKRLLLTINRTGNMSAYGDIAIFHISPNGKETKIGILNNVAVYTPNAFRRLSVNLDNNSSVDLSTGTIRVLYSAQSDKRNQKLAETQLTL